jgi:hypothetical protein
MFKYALLFSLFLSPALFAMEMQHGFVLSDNGKYSTHLVAEGHHSYQVSVTGQLEIADKGEAVQYRKVRQENQVSPKSYFVLMAQKVDITTVKPGQKLIGHIIESPLGDYTPGNILVKSATFTVKEILMSVPNPFFAETK